MSDPSMPGPGLDPVQSDALAREARAWVVRLSSGEATEEDARTVRAWRARSAAHEAAFRDAARLWRRVGDAAPSPHSLRLPSRTGLHRRTLLKGGALAAAIAVTAVAGHRFGMVPGVAELSADHRTGTGELVHLPLPDGSLAELDARTSLDLDFDSRRRGVRMVGGSAVFTVTHDAARPFVVSGAGGTTTAIGTVFAVRRSGQRVDVTCLEGVVEVDCGRATRLGAGEQVTYDRGTLGSPKRVDPAIETAWRRGLLVFRDQPLEEVVAELDRYRSGRILLADASLAARPVSGVFHLARPDEILVHLQRTLNIQATPLMGGFVVLH